MDDLDLNKLSGLQLKAVREAIIAALSPPQFIMLLGQINQPIFLLAPGVTYDFMVFEVLEESKRGGWAEELIRALEQTAPNNSEVRHLRATLEMLAPKLPPVGAVSNQAKLERWIAGQGRIVDFGLYRALQKQVCRVEAGVIFGTGFLVSDDLVLTNYHVVERQALANGGGQGITCRFDYASVGNGRAADGREVKLLNEQWLIASAPYAQGEGSRDGGTPMAGDLDFALLRLAESAGLDSVDGAPRGAVKVSRGIEAPERESIVQIVQHPEGRPVSISLGAITDYGPSGLRMRYAANTLAGSSGSPVLDASLSLVALHHAGDPSWGEAKFNQGIPIGLIIQHLEKRPDVPHFWH